MRRIRAGATRGVPASFGTGEGADCARSASTTRLIRQRKSLRSHSWKRTSTTCRSTSCAENMDFYKEFVAFLGWNTILEMEGYFGAGGANGGSLWFVADVKDVQAITTRRA